MITIKDYVKQEKEKLHKEIFNLTDYPELKIIQVGNNEASNKYVINKMKDAEELGICATLIKLSQWTTTQELQEIVNNNSDCPLIVQLHLPPGVDIPIINKKIDVDGFCPDSEFNCCTPGGIIDYLDAVGFDYEGKLAVVIGRSEIVGKPMAKMLLDKNCTTAVVHSKTPVETRKYLLSEADLVVCAVGDAGFLDPQDCPKAFIVDVGINFVWDEEKEKVKLVGDVQKCASEANRITPVPGGVGLLTRLKLMKNVVLYYKRNGTLKW